MLKITTSAVPARTLRLEGRLTTAWVPELERVAAELAAPGGPVALDLVGLGYADESGMGALERLLAGRFTLAADSSFVRALFSRRGTTDTEELVRAHGGTLYALARRLLPDEPGAGRAVQAAFAAAFASGDRLDEASLRQLVLERVASEMRARASQPASIEALLPAFDAHGQWTAPRSDVRASDDGAEACACLERLPVEHRLALLLCDGEGLDRNTAAEVLGVPPARLRTLLHEGRRALCELRAQASVA